MEKIKDYSYGFIPVLKKANEEYRFLIVKGKNKINSETRSGTWGFPKGHAEGDEDVEAAARRELREETGITYIQKIGSLEYVDNYETVKGGRLLDKTVKYFVGFVESDEVHIQEKEISEFKWATYEEALNLFVFENHKNILINVVKDLEEMESL